MKTEAWSAIGEMANQALDGSQLAVEGMGALAASALRRIVKAKKAASRSLFSSHSPFREHPNMLLRQRKMAVLRIPNLMPIRADHKIISHRAEQVLPAVA